MARQTFKQLVREAAARGLGIDEAPVSMTEMASRCKVSKAHFYYLMCGERGASDEVVKRIAAGLKVTQVRVGEALDLTGRLAEV